METKVDKIEELTKQIEEEKDFEKVVELFAAAAGLVKQTVTSVSNGRGRIVEIIKDMEGFIEKELKLEDD